MTKTTETDTHTFAVVVPDPDNPGKTRHIITREQVLTLGDAARPLARSPLFHDMDDVAIIEIGRRGRHRQIAAKSTLFTQGEIADSVYLVVSGKIRMTMRDRSRRVWSFFDLANSGEGSLVGFSATIADRWAMTATATVETHLLQIPRSDWLDLLRAYPQLAVNLAKYVIDLLDKSQARFIQFAGAFTAQKVAMVLLSRAQDSGVPATAKGWTDLPDPITHEELSSMVGTTRESVVVAMRKLDGECVIRLGKRYSVNITAIQRFLDQSGRSYRAVPRVDSGAPRATGRPARAAGEAPGLQLPAQYLPR